jgi:hypothetical protein
MTAEFQIQHVCDFYIYHTEKALVFSFEFTLIKDLNGDYRRISDCTGETPQFYGI